MGERALVCERTCRPHAAWFMLEPSLRTAAAGKQQGGHVVCCSDAAVMLAQLVEAPLCGQLLFDGACWANAFCKSTAALADKDSTRVGACCCHPQHSCTGSAGCSRLQLLAAVHHFFHFFVQRDTVC